MTGQVWEVARSRVGPGRAGRLLERVLAGSEPSPSGEADGPLRHAVHLPPRSGCAVDWPAWVPPAVRAAFVEQGVRQPWSHQARAAGLAHTGRDVVVATGTASGKSLAYQLPVLAAFAADRRATALYLSPTKALAADQLRALAALDLPDVRAAPYDGDTPLAERDWARQHGRWLFSNPDMLHRSLLPRHGRWASYLRRLRYVVLDECHTYRGLFGSHVALLLRRLLRVCARYGARPTIVLASATVADPGGLRDTARRAGGRGRERRRVARRGPHRRAVGAAPARRGDGRERSPGAAIRGRGGGADAGRPGHRRCAHAGLRPLAARCGADGARCAAGARRGGAGAGGAGVALPGRLPAGGAAGAGGRPGPR